MAEIIPLSDLDIERSLSRPTAGVLATLRDCPGPVMILGVGGKMGTTTAMMVRQALSDLGSDTPVYGVSRFSQASARQLLESQGITTIAADLGDVEALRALPQVPNILFLAGQKFGTDSRPDVAWYMNSFIPGLVAQRFRESRIVVFSTGCVYPFVPVASGGSLESDPLGPMGDYANSCVGRERIFSYFSHEFGTPVALYRLNYSVEYRYGVLVDVATRVQAGEPVSLANGHANVIWQRDAVARAIQCLTHTATPAFALNVTGPETVSLAWLARVFGEKLGREPVLVGEEKPTCWLSNASLSQKLFGYPETSLLQMVDWVADYVRAGGRLLGKPTKFEVRDGQF